jgi:hypothetical protein
MSRDPLEPFDETVIETVAADHDLNSATLRALLERHQRQMRELPGVENLVYEWRKTLPCDPLLERREDVYLLVVEPNVWPQFADALEFDAEALAAVRAVHAEQLTVETTFHDDERDAIRDDEGDDNRDAMIVTRE